MNHPYEGSYRRDLCHSCGLSYAEGEHPPVEDPRNVFGHPAEHDAPGQAEIAAKSRAHVRTELPVMPHGMRTFAVEHDYVSTACLHRLHDQCHQQCTYCSAGCLCVCHRWAVPVESA